MPLILAPENWTSGQLKEQTIELRDGLKQLADAIASMSTPMANPFAVEAGLDLIRRTVDLATEVLRAEEATPILLARVTNQMYEVGASFGYFMLAARSTPPPFPSRTSPNG